MKMDKKTIAIVVVSLALLFGWQMAINKFFPPKPRPFKSASQASTNSMPTAISAATDTNGPVALTPAAVTDSTQPRPTEQTVVLHNDLVQVTMTSWGGGIQSVELLKYKDNTKGNVLLNGPAFAPALALTEMAGADSNAVFAVSQTTPHSVEMRAHAAGGIEVIKTISLGDGYLLTGVVEVTGPVTTNPQAIRLELGTATPTALKELPVSVGVNWLGNGKLLSRDEAVILKKTTRHEPCAEPVFASWAAVKSQFFTMLLTPATNATSVSYSVVDLPRPPDLKTKEPPRGVSAVLELPPTAVAGETARYEFTFYAGPKDYDRLNALGKNQEEVMQFGFWAPISIVLLKAMKLSYKVIPNYGIAIILITIAIKLLFWPIQAKSIKSMKAMQQFQPVVNKLREKYKDDPQRQNAEMMKLYKEHKINPFSGCLPMVVQIPVFFALFAMLRSAIELRGAHFLWIHDLSQPDTVATIAGLAINPLPLLMTGSMLWQQKLTPTTGDAQQAKMMMFMPLIMLFFFYNSSAGLTLYWTIQQLLSIAQQWWSLRQPTTLPVMTTGKGK